MVCDLGHEKNQTNQIKINDWFRANQKKYKKWKKRLNFWLFYYIIFTYIKKGIGIEDDEQ